MSERLDSFGVALALGRPELLDQREDVAVVLAQKLPQMRAAGRLRVLLGHRTAGGKRLVDLIVQLVPVGHDHEGPVAGQRPQHLLREEQHREALARALGVPEHPEPPLVLPDFSDRLDRAVDAQHLMVLADLLDQPALALLEHREALDDVEQPVRPAGAPQHGRERAHRNLALVLDPLPLGKMLEGRRGRADPALAPVREDDDAIVPEQPGDRVPVVAKVLVVGVLQPRVRRLQLDQHQRQAVDEPHEIAPPPVHLAMHPDLRGQEEVVVFRVAPVDHADGHILLAPALVPRLDLHPVLDQAVDVLVGGDVGKRRAVPGQLLDRGLQGVGRQTRVQPLQRRTQTREQHDLMVALARKRAARAPDRVERVAHLPAERPEKLDRRLLDQRVLGEAEAIRAERRAHQSAASAIGSSDSAETSISPEISFGSSRSRVDAQIRILRSQKQISVATMGLKLSSNWKTICSAGTTIGNPRNFAIGIAIDSRSRQHVAGDHMSPCITEKRDIKKQIVTFLGADQSQSAT